MSRKRIYKPCSNIMIFSNHPDNAKETNADGKNIPKLLEFSIIYLFKNIFSKPYQSHAHMQMCPALVSFKCCESFIMLRAVWCFMHMDMNSLDPGDQLELQKHRGWITRGKDRHVWRSVSGHLDKQTSVDDALENDLKSWVWEAESQMTLALISKQLALILLLLQKLHCWRFSTEFF